ncbi:class II aldolase/adducin family protein [Roseiarcaceae bacterium H3SJ34-1]|uniref:class II aldolase/adducin family protein n=1 Tax=Terripilifer ovatus TaxID=3032367 RepID=UPI003AB954ED|nr:class II aldolase/adducin family protein [Roseiarcaceae bacterium H3SJ34-1]
MDAVTSAKRTLVIANRILAHYDVLDAYGHVSVRHPHDPSRYLLSRSLSPASVTEDDIIEFHLDGRPVDADEKRPLYLERFIHGGVFEARPEVNSVLHSHAEDVLPFSITKQPMLPVIHTAGNMGGTIPVWDIADKFGSNTNLLVSNMEQGRDLARCLDCNRIALMRTHGFVSTGVSIPDLVRLAVYIPRNARVQMAAMRMCSPGEGMANIRVLSPGEIAARVGLDPDTPAMRRGWDYWAREVGCEHLLSE